MHAAGAGVPHDEYDAAAANHHDDGTATGPNDDAATGHDDRPDAAGHDAADDEPPDAGQCQNESQFEADAEPRKMVFEQPAH